MPGEGKKVNILIVDDDAGVRDVIMSCLVEAGYGAGVAGDGREALEKLADGEFDLVITDLKMPGMDGRELLRAMADKYPSIPRLVLTGYGTDDDIIHALKTGASDFITKPIMDFTILLHAVGKAIRVKKLNDERDRYVEQLTRINEVISMLNSGMETEEIFKMLYVSLKRTIPFNWLALAMIDDSGESISVKTIETDSGVGAAAIKSIPLEDKALRDCARNRSMLLLEDLREYLRTTPGSRGAKMLLDIGMRSSIFFPLIINNATRGFFIFASENPGAFESEHAMLLESLSGQISLGVQRGELLRELELHTRQLEQMVKVRTFEVLKTQKTTIFALSRLAETRDLETGEHLERIRKYCVLIAQIMKYSGHESEISNQYLRDLYDSSILHDIGKVGIPDNILLKPGALTAGEFEIIKTHTMIGYNALRAASGDLGDDSFLKMAMEITRSHHERWDGAGYPDGSAGESIPLSARIVSICDVYDALTTERPYKNAFSHEKAVEIMKGEAGKYDPRLFKIFLENEAEFNRIRIEFQ